MSTFSCSVERITVIPHPHYCRKIAKSISEAYLLKSTGEELQ